MLTILAILSFYISVAFGGWCGGSKWNVDYSGDKCDLSNGIYKMKCQEKGNTGTCGMRLSSKAAVGKGTYSAKIKAAPGPGINTAWYLFSYGRFNDKSYAWNEIDVEILGQQISGGKSKIWTNVWTGYYTQHYQLVTVPWDATTGYHTYQIKITSSQIKWVFDGKTYRTFNYGGYGDLKSTINTKDFQILMALWGSNGGWNEMGSMWNNWNSFPMYAYFKNVWFSSAYTEEEAAAEGEIDAAGIAAIVIVIAILICALIGGVIYYKRRRKRLNGDGASFKDEEEAGDTDSTPQDSKEAAINNTPSGENDNVTATAGYNMEPINPEIEVQVEVETQA